MSEQSEDEPFEVAERVDTSEWDDAMHLRSEALLAHDLEMEDPDNHPSGPNYER